VQEEDASSGAFAKIGGGGRGGGGGGGNFAITPWKKKKKITSYFGHDRVENHHEALVVNTVFQRKVHTVVLALFRAYVFDISRA
jgi:hypothetical protein